MGNHLSSEKNQIRPDMPTYSGIVQNMGLDWNWTIGLGQLELDNWTGQLDWTIGLGQLGLDYWDWILNGIFFH